MVADGTRPAWRPSSFGRVLADVPCTGLGALRRRPESRWRRTPADLDILVPLQRGPARIGAGRRRARRPGRVRHLLAASPRDHRGRRGGALDPRRRAASSRRSRSCPGSPAAYLGAVPAAVAAPARHRRHVRLLSQPERASIESGRGHPDPAEHPVRGLREPAARHRGDRQRRRRPRGRDGQPLRAEPDARPAGGRVDPQGDAGAARHPPDDRGPGPLGARVRRGRCGVGDLPRRGRGRTDPAGPRAPHAGRPGRDGAQAGDPDRAVRRPAARARHGA